MKRYNILPPISLDNIDFLQESSISYKFIDIETQRKLIFHDENKPVPLASVSKTLVIPPLIQESSQIDSDYKISVIADSKVNNGILNGNIIIEGEGDSGLTFEDLTVLCKKIKEKGIRSIEGRVLLRGKSMVDLQSLDPDVSLDLPYNPGFCPININNNCVEIKKNFENYMNYSASPPLPDIKFSSFRSIDHYFKPLHYDKEKKLILVNIENQSFNSLFPIPDLYNFYTSFLEDELKKNGINISQKRRDSSRGDESLIFEFIGSNLSKLLSRSILNSSNLDSEAVFQKVFFSLHREAQSYDQLGKLLEDWFKSSNFAASETLSFYRASGLSPKNRASHSFVCSLLAWIYSQQDSAYHLTKIFPQYGLSGTLKSRNLIAEKNVPVYAKTGSLHFISTLAGVILCKKPVAFSISCINNTRRAELEKTGQGWIPMKIYQNSMLWLELAHKWQDAFLSNFIDSQSK